MINFDDLELAFLYVNSDADFDKYAVVHRKTGEFFYQSDFTGTDEFPEDVESDDYIEIPDKNDLNLGRTLVFDFCRSLSPGTVGQSE